MSVSFMLWIWICNPEYNGTQHNARQSRAGNDQSDAMTGEKQPYGLVGFTKLMWPKQGSVLAALSLYFKLRDSLLMCSFLSYRLANTCINFCIP